MRGLREATIGRGLGYLCRNKRVLAFSFSSINWQEPQLLSPFPSSHFVFLHRQPFQLRQYSLPFSTVSSDPMATTSTSTASTHVPNNLVLCFDGTGNTFSGSNADTNVVKLLNKLDRNNDRQYHYYQSKIICSIQLNCSTH